MELFSIRYAIAVADTGSFSQAAQACFVGQPALSQQIAKLEKEVGVSLFHRGPRGITPTEAGHAFVRRGREILQLADALRAEMARYAGVEKGTLNLGVITSLECISFGDMLSDFCRAYPNISVNIRQAGTYSLMERLLDRSLDLAFLNRPAGKLPPALRFTKLGEDRYSLAVPASHPLAGRGRVRLGELKAEPFIFHEQGQVAADLCRNACREAGFEPNIICRSASPTTGLYMVRGGLGVAFFPSEEFASHKIQGVAELKLEEAIIKEVGVARRTDVSSPVLEAAERFVTAWKPSRSPLPPP